MKTVEELRANQWGDIQVGDVWQHYKGNLYEIVELGFIEHGVVPAVIYKSMTDDIIWVRPIIQWNEKVFLPLDDDMSACLCRYVLHARL